MTGTVSSVSIVTRMFLWIPWAKIAVKSEATARQVRDRAADLTAKGLYCGDELVEETEAVLVVITAAANALEALYGGLLSRAPSLVPPDRTRPDWKKVYRALDACFQLPPAAQQGWPNKFKRLFAEKRNSVVHFKEHAGTPTAHPLGFQTAPEHCEFTIEESERLVDLLLDVLTTCGASATKDRSLDGYRAELASNARLFATLRADLR